MSDAIKEETVKEYNTGLDYKHALNFAKAVVKAREKDPVLQEALERVEKGYNKVLSSMKRKPLNKLFKLKNTPWDIEYTNQREKLVGAVYSAVSAANSLLKDTRMLESSAPAVTEGDILEQLESLNNNYDIRYRHTGRKSTERHAIEVTLPARDLLDPEGNPLFKVGPFVIEIPARYISMDWDAVGVVYVTANEDTRNISGNGYIHPHVKANVLCLGDYTNILSAAAGAGQILVYVEQISTCLTHYNPESPHLGINLWHVGTCQTCGSSIPYEEEKEVCPNCEATYCHGCTTKKTIDGEEVLLCSVCGVSVSKLVLPKNWKKSLGLSYDFISHIPSTLLSKCKVCGCLTMDTFMSRSGKCVVCAGGKS